MRILLDLDGVLTDFVGGAMFVLNKNPKDYPHYAGITWDFWTQFGLSNDGFWYTIATAGPSFWEYLQPFPWTEEVLRVVETYDPDFRICTSPTDQESCYFGKMTWIERNLPLVYKRRRFHITPHKKDLARKDTILIDDYGVNCDTFCQRDGKAILFRQPWSTPFYSQFEHDWESINAPGARASWLESQLQWYANKYPQDFQ